MADSIRDRVLKVLAAESGKGLSDLKPGDHLQMDLGLDSLDMARLQMEIENEFDIDLPDNHFRNVYTVGGLIAFVAREV
jgi:acyl carrier protein